MRYCVNLFTLDFSSFIESKGTLSGRRGNGRHVAISFAASTQSHMKYVSPHGSIMYAIPPSYRIRVLILLVNLQLPNFCALPKIYTQNMLALEMDSLLGRLLGVFSDHFRGRKSHKPNI